MWTGVGRWKQAKEKGRRRRKTPFHIDQKCWCVVFSSFFHLVTCKETFGRHKGWVQVLPTSIHFDPLWKCQLLTIGEFSMWRWAWNTCPFAHPNIPIGGNQMVWKGSKCLRGGYTSPQTLFLSTGSLKIHRHENIEKKCQDTCLICIPFF